MLRKITYAVIILLILVTLSSCVPHTPEPPYGVWMSEDPHIVLYFKPEYRMPVGMPSYLGFYTIEGVETKVFARFGNGMQFTIYRLDGITEGGILGMGRLISGTYRVRGNEIRYTFHETIQVYGEQPERQFTIFRPLETYTSIDPYDWFPHFFPREE